MFIKIVILVFILLEFSNVLVLYFAPGSRFANAVGFFNAWEKSKMDSEIHEFVKYLVNWIAGVKLMLLLQLALIVFYANQELQRLSLVALALTTALFYWRLFPSIRKMDVNNQIKPRRYSTLLGIMIFVFIVFFLAAVVL